MRTEALYSVMFGGPLTCLQNSDSGTQSPVSNNHFHILYYCYYLKGELYSWMQVIPPPAESIALSLYFTFTSHH